MGIFDIFGMGGGMAAGSPSLTDQAKQFSVLEALGLGNGQTSYTKPIGPMPGTGAPMESQAIDPQQYSAMQGSRLADLGRQLSTWGAGVSKASGPTYGPPRDFGQVLAGGTEALNEQGDKDLERQKLMAETSLYKAKAGAGPDFEAKAQQALVKLKMGIPLTPEDSGYLQAQDTYLRSKQTATPDALGNLRMVPNAGILTPEDLAKMQATGGGQAPRQTEPIPQGFTPEKIMEYKKLRGIK